MVLPGVAERPTGLEEALDDRGAGQVAEAGPGLGAEFGEEKDDERVLPRSIASRAAFDNAMALDLAMGGSTNTVPHLPAAAHEAELDYTLADIEARSHQVPCLCKVAPSSPYLMEDVHRAGGIPAILGELHRAGLLHADVHAGSLDTWLTDWDIRGASPAREAIDLFHAAPGGTRSAVAFSQSARWESLDLDAAAGCIRDAAHAYSPDAGLAVLRGNLAPDGAVVKPAGVPIRPTAGAW
ncbi:dihydroxy-acid dehydratase [Streptosporangium canum]